MKIFNRAERYTLFALYGSIDICSFIDFTVAYLEEGHDRCILIGGDFNFEFDDFFKVAKV